MEVFLDPETHSPRPRVLILLSLTQMSLTRLQAQTTRLTCWGRVQTVSGQISSAPSSGSKASKSTARRSSSLPLMYRRRQQGSPTRDRRRPRPPTSPCVRSIHRLKYSHSMHPMLSPQTTPFQMTSLGLRVFRTPCPIRTGSHRLRPSGTPRWRLHSCPWT